LRVKGFGFRIFWVGFRFRFRLKTLDLGFEALRLCNLGFWVKAFMLLDYVAYLYLEFRTIQEYACRRI